MNKIWAKKIPFRLEGDLKKYYKEIRLKAFTVKPFSMPSNI